MRSCYTSPVVLQRRNSSVPPAAWIQLHFQLLKGGLINLIIQSSIFMAEQNAVCSVNFPRPP